MIPYRWYSPRAVRHDSVKLRSRQYSLDERRYQVQNPYGPALVEAALGCVCILELSFCTRIPCVFRLALNVFVQGFFFWRQHDERQRLYASGFAACKKGLRVDIAQPDGGCRGRKRGQDHRTGLAPEIRSGSCGAQCAGILHRRSAGSDHVCDIGAVLSLRKAAALRGCDSGRGHSPGGRGFR